MATIVSAPRMFDGTGNATVENAAVLIEDGRIVSVTQGTIAGDHRRISLPNLTLLPGLIDTHVHLTIGHSPWTLATYLATSPNQQLLDAVENGRRALLGGVTTVRDCGGQTQILLALRQAIAAGRVEGPRLLISGSPITTTAGHMWYFGIEADGVAEVRKSVRGALRDGVDFIKVAASGGQMTPHSNARQAQYSVPELIAIVEETRRLGTYSTAHAHAAASVANVVAAGFPMIEHAGFLAASEVVGNDFYVENGYAYDPEVVRRLVDGGTWVGQYIFAAHRNVYFGTMDRYTPEVAAVLRKEVPRRVEILRDMRARGVRFITSSDSWLDIAGDLIRSVEVAVRHVGINSLEALAQVTSRGAEAIGLGRETGSIQVGKSADLIAVAGDPSQDIATLHGVRWVMVRGRVVVDNATANATA